MVATGVVIGLSFLVCLTLGPNCCVHYECGYTPEAHHTDIDFNHRGHCGFWAGPFLTDGYDHATGRFIPVVPMGYEVRAGYVQIDRFW